MVIISSVPRTCPLPGVPNKKHHADLLGFLSPGQVPSEKKPLKHIRNFPVAGAAVRGSRNYKTNNTYP